MLAGLGYGALTPWLKERAVGFAMGALLGVLFGFAFCLAYLSTWHRGPTEQRGGGGFRDNASPRESLRRLAEGAATVVTAFWRRLPWRYMTFLQVARKAGVLRGPGAHYQFLRDFLAEKALVR